MDERGIIIADRDAEYRKQMADFFEKAGYSVETTDSAVHVLCSILEKQTPVLLLGTDFDKKVSSADLIHLLKKCNRHLHVIMVSDDMPIAEARQVRHEGIFYHALKPSANGDTEEIGMAVECAFEKREASDESHQEPVQKRETVVSEDAEQETAQPKRHPKVLPWLIALAALIFGLSALSLAAAERVNEGSNAGIWIFLGFCALIVATQMLPIFRIKMAWNRSVPTQQERDPLDRN